MGALSHSELAQVDAWWRAANYLSVGQIYLLDNPLLTEPLTPEHVKPRLLGHWGATAGPAWWPARGWKGRTARSTRACPRTCGAWPASSASSPSRAASPATTLP